jgi:hypothetical protein
MKLKEFIGELQQLAKEQPNFLEAEVIAAPLEYFPFYQTGADDEKPQIIKHPDLEQLNQVVSIVPGAVPVKGGFEHKVIIAFDKPPTEPDNQNFVM